MKTKLLFAFAFAALTSTFTLANNIQVSNITLTNQNTTARTSVIQFDLSWENSWRISSGPSNWDAAWVFAKFRVGGGDWQHARLSGRGTLPAGATVEVRDQVGAFVYRSADGSGDLDLQAVQLVWNYGLGVDANSVVDVQVFAIEMVYVPQGAFSLGTGRDGSRPLESEERGEFYTTGVAVPAIYMPYRVTSESAITVANTVGNLYYNTLISGNQGDQLGPIPAAFPKGFAAFYVQKYETSQSQWVAFFNTLTPAQQANLDLTGLVGKNSDAEINRNGVRWDGVGNATTSLPDLPVSYVNNALVRSYLDWAGLRFFTETEFEKANRGPVTPVSDEYAWGSASISLQTFTLTAAGTPDESIQNLLEGVGHANIIGLSAGTRDVLRTGIFSASAVNVTRQETGGSYYGIMELTGNVAERVISVGTPEGRGYTGVHGDGILPTNGLSAPPDWPSTDSGFSNRGGAKNFDRNSSRVSDRFRAALPVPNIDSGFGFRGARTAQ